MVFSSITFLVLFLPLFSAIYYAVPMKMKNITMFAFSLVFYAWGEPVYVIVMLFSTVADYTAGVLMNYFNSKNKVRTIILTISIIVNIALLGVFKYASFVVTSLNGAFDLSLTDPNLPLPIGISFYTFQSMSYTIDIYKRKINVQKNIINFISYVTLFPQMVAGPIVRYSEIQNDIDNRALTAAKVASGIGLFIKGLAKKVLLANNIGALWAEIRLMNFAEMPALTAWLGILAFTFQIYFDFSGYSDMARGLGRMIGFEFPQNFNLPYIAKSVSEFWRRWHITLAEWFKSYIYFPLGGNRVGKVKLVRNLLIVWGITGLWHGASWNFVIWGLYFGILIIGERFIWGNFIERLPNIIKRTYTLFLVIIGWVMFELSTVGQIAEYVKAMFGGAGVFADSLSLYFFTANFIIFLLCAFFSGELPQRIIDRLSSVSPKSVQIAIPIVQAAGLILCISYILGSDYNPFLYFRF